MLNDQCRQDGENMEDRYLFRAKRVDNGEWVQGNKELLESEEK